MKGLHVAGRPKSAVERQDMAFVVEAGIAEAGESLYFGDRKNGTAVEGLQNTVTIACRTPEAGGDGGAVLFAESEDAAGGGGGFGAHGADSAQEECKPFLPRPRVTHRRSSP
jgi:hypothetical protein